MFEDDEYIEDDTHAIGEHLDPLDAQNSGRHDRDYELGHEEIRLNLDAVEAPHYVPPPAPAHIEAPPGDESK